MGEVVGRITDSGDRMTLDWKTLARLNVPLVEVTGDHRIARCTAHMAEMLGKTPDELIGQPCNRYFCHGADVGDDCFCLQPLSAEGELPSRRFVIRNRDGHSSLLFGQALPHAEGAFLILQDMTAQLQVRRQLQHHEQQSEFLSRVSNRMITLPADRADDGINFALEELGRFLQADRCYLFRFNSERQTISNCHEWVSNRCRPDLENLQDIPVAELPWFWEAMASHQPLVVNDTADLPPEAGAEQQYWQEKQIGALLVVPLVDNGQICGFLGVDAVAQCRRWQKSDHELLSLVGDLVRGLVSRKQGIEALENSSRRFATLADAVPALIWETGVDGRLCYGNRHWQQFTGWTAERRDQGWDAFVHVDDLAKMVIKTDACLQKGRLFSQELRLRRADGEYRWMEINGAPITAGDRICGMIGSAFDITDHKMVEEQLLALNDSLEQRVEERTAALQKLNNEMRTLSLAVEQSPCSIIITDLDGCIEYVNPKFSEVTGYTEKEAREKNLRVLKGEDGCSDDSLLWKTLTAGEEWRGEFHNQRKNGEFFWEMASISPIADSDGNIRHYLAVKEDITERKELEQAVLHERDELQEAQRELQRAYNELKATQSQMLQQEKMASIGQLAAGVAHEINNPVGFIKSNLATLGKYVDKLRQFIELQAEILAEQVPAEKREALKAEEKKLKIRYLLDDIPDLIAESLDGAERVKTIVQNLKSFSRVDQSEYSEADINECLESTINIVWNELKYKVTLERDLAELPRVKCYPQQLNQVFMNILVNAAQAIETKGEIVVQTAVEDASVVVRISDDGCGIPEENLTRIFEPFFTTKEVGKGTGLGMSISYEIIKKHGGDIEVDSRVGEGTTFRISLPLEGAPAPDTDDDQVSN
ncbi:hypothetical protein C2E25_09715 [Geothermobacter hydrogeniphilus]|uniref:histidine kinase n=2 Tax=Geothermobacter hydrogeniphilus TaxID=1969733 RepID=A0A2K2H9D8_9BACT|nr:hypothetical protein C2E25_09715 [Geothermobacter hydrogeniphilus]